MREAAPELVAAFRETGKITDAHMDKLKLKIPRMIGDVACDEGDEYLFYCRCRRISKVHVG